MDPNAVLAEIRAYVKDDESPLAEAVIALDEWMSRGGFLPDAWV